MNPALTAPVAFQLFLQNVGVVVVAASVIPAMLVPIIPLLLLFLYLRRFYLSASRDVKRLEATSMFRLSFASLPNVSVSDGRLLLMFVSCLSCVAARSPVFSHLSSSLQGLWTIRAFGAQERQKHAFDAHQDLHSG